MHSCIRVRVRAPFLALVLVAALAAAAIPPASSETSSASTSTSARRAPAPPLLGGTAYRESGETFRDAYLRVMDKYDGLDAIRMFFPGLPQGWSQIRADVGRTPLVVSFKAPTGGVVAGKYDAQLRRWFANAPTKRRTFWTYWHEPENDGVNQRQYRRAWRHIRALANEAENRRLRATLILMCWTLDRRSGRNWRDYYPGNRTIHTLGFDCYNTAQADGYYRDPALILKPVIATAASVGKPWGIAEFGSLVVKEDGGERGRADWLAAFARQAQMNGAKFATYFDSSVGGDFRLHDAPSATAWRNAVNAS